MKIEKLPSGSFRVRPTYKGKRYSLTFDRKPTKDMIRQELFRRIQNDKESAKRSMPFLEAARKYTDSKKNVLSPTTIREYMNIPDRLSDWFVALDIDKITQNDINKQINELALKRKPKTVRNYHGFISAVLRTFRPDFMIYTHLPQKIKNEPYIPSDDDIRRLTEAAAGTIFEIPLKLACYGLRRSEICALELSDINDTKVSVNKAMVLDHDKKWVIKTTKTIAGTRVVPIDKDLASLIRNQGYVYDGNPSSISDWMSDTEKSSACSILLCTNAVTTLPVSFLQTELIWKP